MSKVLIVEDETVLREAYVMVLTMEGYEVASAADGQEALVQLKKFKPDVILLDILMPIMDGHAFLKHAQIQKNYPGTKVITFSNLSNQQKLTEMTKLGTSRYILKSSMSPKELVRQIEEVLAEN